MPPLPVYAKKNQSQIQLSPSTGTQKKKSGKDGTVFGGEGEEPGSGRAAGTKDSSRKDSDAASAQGLPARRTSTKQGYFATYYQEKTAADATMPEATYAPSTTQALPYEPIPLAPQFSSAQSGLQKGKRKVTKGGHGSGYAVHAASGKYGRADGPPQPVMTEAEQRAATKKEIIEAFEI